MRWRSPRSLRALVGAIALAALGAAPGPGEIISVGFDGLDLPPLAAADQARLDALLGVQQPQVLSDLSPDGTTLVVALSRRVSPGPRSLHFLDLPTGTLTAATVLENDLFEPELPLRWLSNDTLRFVQQDPFGQWEIVTINRKTAIVSRTQIQPTQEEQGEILGVSPNFSTLVVRIYEGEEDVVYAVSLPSLDRLELARLPSQLAVQPPRWSATGDRLALVLATAEGRQLDERAPHSPSLADPLMQDALGNLAAAENPFVQRNGLRVYDLARPDPLVLALGASDLGGDTVGTASLSPDGERLLVKRYRPSVLAGRSHPSYAFPESAYFQVLDLESTVLHTLEADPLRGPEESDGQFVTDDRLLFWGTHGLNRHLYTYDLAQMRFRPLPLPPGSVDPQSVMADAAGTRVIYSLSSVQQPPEIYAFDLRGLDLAGGGEPRSLTQINAAAAASNRVRVEEVRFVTPQGDRVGLLIQPGGSAFPPQGVPVVLWQQGGPGGGMANEFATEVEMPLNLLPNFGVAVLAVPLAGREGFGPAVYRALADQDNFGRIDIAEGAAILRQMIARGWTTAAQVGLTGCSYGGYYTAQMLWQFPELVAAANPQCTLLDTLTEWQLGYGALLAYLVGRTPLEAPQTYLQNSPLYNAASAIAPTLIFHGSEDFLPIDIVRNFHDQLDRAGAPVTLYTFEGAGHSLYGTSYQPLAAQLQIEFFRQHLRPR